MEAGIEKVMTLRQNKNAMTKEDGGCKGIRGQIKRGMVKGDAEHGIFQCRLLDM
jgi:hypothetical protein